MKDRKGYDKELDVSDSVLVTDGYYYLEICI